MNLEALAVVGLFVVVLGLLLFFVARLWMRYMPSASGGKYPALRLTRLGWLLILTAMFVLIAGSSLQFLAPESALGELTKTPGGRFIYFLGVFVLFWIIEVILKAKGIRLIKKTHQ